MRNLFTLLLVCALPAIAALAQDTTGTLPPTPTTAPAGRYPRTEFLPKGHLFEPLRLDPLEAQTSVSVLPSYHMDGERYDGTFVQFTFGLIKPFVRRYRGPDRASEWSLDVASYTQFEIFDDAAGVQRRRLVNTDYRVSFIHNRRYGPNNWRFRLYHLSSHLGDDYLIRNQINFYTPNAVNYELIDVTYSRYVGAVRLYGGAGFGLRRPVERKRLSGQIGIFYRKPQVASAVRLVGGVDVKVWQQTNYRPGVKAGIGIEVGRTVNNNLVFMLETYSGFRPYSQYEAERTRWFGIGAYFHPI